MIVIGTDIVERYFSARAGHRGIKAARSQYDAWRAIVEKAQWKAPEDVKNAHPKASILKSGRVVFNIKAHAIAESNVSQVVIKASNAAPLGLQQGRPRR